VRRHAVTRKNKVLGLGVDLEDEAESGLGVDLEDEADAGLGVNLEDEADAGHAQSALAPLLADSI